MTTAVAMLMVAPAFADPGHSGDDVRAYGEPGTVDHKSRVVKLKMVENGDGLFFSPDKVFVRAGEQIRFVISNPGEFDHEFVLGTEEENIAHGIEMAKNPDMEHDDPNAIKLTPNHSGEILWSFTTKGTFDFSCLLPGHRENGMFGTIIVQ